MCDADLEVRQRRCVQGPSQTGKVHYRGTGTQLSLEVSNNGCMHVGVTGIDTGVIPTHTGYHGAVWQAAVDHGGGR